MNTWKKLLSMLLVLAMLLVGPMTTGLSKATAESDTTEQPATDKGRVLETEDLDPADFHVNLFDTGDREFVSAEPEEIDPEKIVRVSIFLEGKSTIDEGFSTKNIAHNTRAMDYRRSLELQQATMQTKIEGKVGHELTVNAKLTLLVNAISVDIPYKDIEVIKAMPGVKSVEFENFYYAQEATAEPNTANTSEYMVGASNAWAAGYTGAGSKIAILDTGIDKDHISFNEDAFLHAIDEVRAEGKTVELMEQIDEETLAQLNAKKRMSAVTAEDLYISTKIPFAFNYAAFNLDTAHNDNASNHGSHVAGISAANRYLKDGDGYKDAAEAVYAVGMAPDAQLIVMDVFAASGGTTDSIYFLGIEDAIILGCDAANLSLGSPNPGFTYSNSYQEVLNRIASDSDINMVVAMAAGNNGSQTDELLTDLYIEDVSLQTSTSPGTYLNSLCVASADNVGNTGLCLMVGDHKIVFTDNTNTKKEKNDQGEVVITILNPPITTIGGEHEFVYIDGVGKAEEYAEVNEAVSLEGKIVIVNRGDLTFMEKGNNAISVHPRAVLVANNQPGMFNMSLANEETHEYFEGNFPMVMFAESDANWIKDNSPSAQTDNYTYYTGSITVPNETDFYSEVTGTREEATMSDFSGWGVPGSLIMKPEITAPGGSIWSVNGTSTSPDDAGSGIDRYVAYSGTSMATPHIAGLSAIVAQYLRENPPENEALTAKYSTRAIIQSLLMSTATPMMDGENYYSLLQQGAGLVEVNKAVTAPSVIMMDDAHLTTATKSDLDGKVKVELGDDPERTGEYTYKFTIYNTSDIDLEYEFDTKMFTQDYYTEDGFDFLDAATVGVDATASYVYSDADASHDVNKDGTTDAADAQAILDYLTGKVDGAALNLEAGEMDNDGKLTTYDAELILHYEAVETEGMFVSAHSSKQVTVKIKLNETFDAYTNGAYVEGFTYVTGAAVDEEGVDYAHEHTIPILGFYGDYSEPSMFDCVTKREWDYETTDKIPYCIEYVKDSQGNIINVIFHTSGYTSWMENGQERKVLTSNPFMDEGAFYEDRLATRSDAVVGKVYYNLIRNAGTVGYALSKVNGFGGDVIKVLNGAIKSINEEGLFYYASQDAWYNNTPKSVLINKDLSTLGLAEGDTLRVAYYALPEVTAMEVNVALLDQDLADAYGGSIVYDDVFTTLIENNSFGKGTSVGLDFLIDDTAPEIGEVVFNEETGKMTIEVSDNERVAYVALLSIDGEVKYAEVAPGEKETTVEVDAANAVANALSYVAIFVGDYAGNRKVVAAKVNDIDYTKEDAYVFFDVMTEAFGPDTDYLLGQNYNISQEMNLFFLYRNGSNASAATKRVYLGTESSDYKVYVLGPVTANYTMRIIPQEADNTYIIKNGNYYLTITDNGTNLGKIAFTQSEQDATVFDLIVSNNKPAFHCTGINGNDAYLSISSGSVGLSGMARSLNIFRKGYLKEPVDVDPYKVKTMTLPNKLNIFEGQSTVLTPSVTPMTADPSVTWVSSDATIATVDENGNVTGIATGDATITATSVTNPDVSASTAVHVYPLSPRELNAIVWDVEADTYFSKFNISEPSEWSKLHEHDMQNQVESLQTAIMTRVEDDEEHDHLELYAGTLDTSNQVTYLYQIDRATYSATGLGENGADAEGYVFALGMAPTPLYGFAMYSYAYYVIVGNLIPEYDEEEGGTYSLLPYGFAKDPQEAWIAAVAAGDPLSSSSQRYYYLNEDGDIYSVTLNLNNGSIGSPNRICSTGISTSYLYQGLYYDGTYLYWSHYNEDIESSELIIINPTDGTMMRDGRNFGDKVWPVVGLYQDEVLPPWFDTHGINSDVIANLKPLENKSQLKNEAFDMRLKEDAERIAKIMNGETEAEPINEPGGLNALRGTYEKKTHRQSETRKADGSSSTSYPNVTVKLYENKASTNGFFTVKYDPQKLTFVSAEKAINEYSSIYVNKTKGEIKFAYAAMDAIAAKTTLATLKFKAKGQDTTVTVTTTERGSNVALNETSTIQIKGQEPKKATVTVKASDVQFNGSTPYRVYNGKAQTPGYVVKDEKGNVIPASKYKAEYKENVKAGTAYIFITFPNKDYKDCRTWFKIYLPATTSTKVENVENGIKISWSKVEGAAGYVVYRRAWNLKDAGWTTFERWNNTTSTSWVDTKVYAGTRYQYGVKAYFARRTDPVSGAQIGGNVGDNYNLGIVGPLKTTVRITTRVLNSVTPGSKKLTAKWTGSSLFTGYQVQVATDAKFTQNVQTVTVDKASTYEKAVTGLKAKTTYYVRVRSYHIFDGTTYYGQWSNVLNGATK